MSDPERKPEDVYIPGVGLYTKVPTQDGGHSFVLKDSGATQGKQPRGRNLGTRLKQINWKSRI